jgi:hypothetical protein
MKKKFEYEFEDASCGNTISFEYNSEKEEKMAVIVENGIPAIYLNREALLLLAKTFVKIALGTYSSGFHLHLSQDFDADKPEAVRIILHEE